MVGIQAAIKLARTGRQIYVENSITREITFVLPSQLDNIAARADEYAESLKNSSSDGRRGHFRKRFEQVYNRTFDASTPEERDRATEELIQLYLLDLSEGLATLSDIHGNMCEIAGMFACRQWSRRDSPFPDPPPTCGRRPGRGRRGLLCERPRSS